MLNIKKTFLGLLVLLFSSLFFQACAQKNEKTVEDDKIKVIVSVIPQKYFVEKIGGDKVDVTYMVEKGASPATYEPKPTQMEEISETKGYIKIGVPFEKTWLPRFESTNRDLVIFDQGEEVEKIEIEQHGHEEESGIRGQESGGEGLDPHIWLSVKRAAKQAENITAALVKLDPDNEEYYKSNFIDFENTVENLDADLTRTFESIENRNFMVFHPAFGYIADDYGLKQIAIEVEGKEPSLKELEKIIEEAEEENIKTVFVEPQFNKESAEVIASQIEAKVVEIDPLAEEWEENLRRIAFEIVGK